MNKNMDTYEKKYKNALTIAQSRFKIEKDESVLTCLGMMFPELRESEDERIRTLLVCLVQWAKTFSQSGFDPDTSNKMLSYLEKQKEQNPAWSEEDDWKRKELIQYLGEKGDYRTAWMTWLKSIRPQHNQEWSKEDEILRVRTINRLETLNFHGISGKEIRESIDWLKSLHPNKQD